MHSLLVIGALALALACGTLAVRLLARDARDLRPAWLSLAGVALALLSGVVAVSAPARPGSILAQVLLATSPVLLAGPAGVLVTASAARWRAEGASRRTLRPALVALLLGGVHVLCLVVLLHRQVAAGDPSLAGGPWWWLLAACAWAEALASGFLGYAALYPRLTRPVHPAYVVTLGSTLVGGQVSPELAQRLARSVAIYRAEVAAGRRPLLVMSGGKGSAHQPAEAEAMARWAVEHGVPAEDVVQEGGSTTTEENFRRVAALVASHPLLGPTAAGLAVTSTYHVLRAARMARLAGLPVQVAGARTDTAWSSSALRELTLSVGLGKGRDLATALALTLPVPLLWVLAVLLP